MTTAPAFPLIAYVDTSAVLAVAFQEQEWETIAHRLAGFPVRLSSNLLEAETRSTYQREGLAFDDAIVSSIGWVHPNRSLGPEMAKALSAGGYLKGADLWHIAVALYVDETVLTNIAFITLDNRQRTVAAGLGFAA